MINSRSRTEIPGIPYIQLTYTGQEDSKKELKYMKRNILDLNPRLISCVEEWKTESILHCKLEAGSQDKQAYSEGGCWYIYYGLMRTT